MLQPGGTETRTCPVTWGCRELRPRDCPSKHAEWTFLGLDVLSAPLHCLPLRPSPWKQNKMFLINSRTLTLLPLYGTLIKLPSRAIPTESDTTERLNWTELNDLMWPLPIKVQAERKHFVFLPWRAGGPPDSLLAKLYVSVFSLGAHPCFRSFSPTVLDAGI